jgi:hypothetical protein
MTEDVAAPHERVIEEEPVSRTGLRGRTLLCPVDAYRDALRDERARRAFAVLRGAANWICYTCANAEALVMTTRPRSDPAGGLDLVEAIFTPAQFACLARHALAQDQHILAALRAYLALMRDGRRDRAAALVDTASRDGCQGSEEWGK